MYSSMSIIALVLCLLPFVTAVDVEVGFQGGIVFNPANITAPNGTLVNFLFKTTRRHSVTQSSFANPCTYLAASGGSPAGFDSGEQTQQQFTINITDDTKPIWYHCKELKHCGMGMVGSINAPTSGSNTYDAFLAAAKAIGNSEAPGGEGGPITGGVGGIATAPPSSLGSSTPTSAANSSSGSSTGTTTGTSSSSTTKPSNSALPKQIPNTVSTLFLGMLAVVLA